MTRRRGRLRAASRWLLDLVLRNFWLKLMALLMALGFYGFIHGTQDAERTLAVPLITYVPPPSHNRQLITQIPNTLSVTVSGLKSQLDGLRGESVGPVPIDLTDGRTARFEFEPSMLNLPPRVTVKRIVPSVLELKWEDIVAKRVAVKVPFAGELPASLEVEGEPEIEPGEIEARGPSSLLNVIHVVHAADFDLRGVGEGETIRELGLERPPELVGWDVSSVVATIRVARKSETKSFPKLKVEIVGMTRATARPAVVDVVIRGLPEEVAKIRPDAIVPRVEPRKAAGDVGQTGSALVDVLVTLPGLEVEVTPPKVFVRW